MLEFYLLLSWAVFSQKSAITLSITNGILVISLFHFQYCSGEYSSSSLCRTIKILLNDSGLSRSDLVFRSWTMTHLNILGSRQYLVSCNFSRKEWFDFSLKFREFKRIKAYLLFTKYSFCRYHKITSGSTSHVLGKFKVSFKDYTNNDYQ